MTCDRCPRRDTCTTLCEDMEAFLGQGEPQSKGTKSSMETPGLDLIAITAEQAGDTMVRALTAICTFCKRVPYGAAMVESILVLRLIENYDIPRVVELAGADFAAVTTGAVSRWCQEFTTWSFETL